MATTRWHCALFGVGSALPALFVACAGGSPTSDVSGLNDSGATTDAGDGGDQPDGYTLDDVCERTAPLICQMRKSCCQGGPGYDEAACLAYTKSHCAEDVAAVRGGREQFHPERIDPCIPKYQQILSQSCTRMGYEPTVLAEIANCQFFTGSQGEGTGCERASQCEPSDAQAAFTSCADYTNVCQTIRFLAAGDDCAFGEAGGMVVCGAGLYCSAFVDTDGGVVPGKCKPKTPLGSACRGRFECGHGNYCDTICKAGQPGGAPCSADGNQCASLECGYSDQGMICVPPLTRVKPAECGKP